MIKRSITTGLLLLLTIAAAAQEQDTFDAAAEVAALSQWQPPVEFKRLWTSKQRVRLLHGLAVSANGSRALALTSDGLAVVYDGDSGKVVSRLAEKPEAWISCTALSSDGRRAALGLISGQVLIVDTATGKVLRRHAPAKADVEFVHLSSDGKTVSWLDVTARCFQADAEGQKVRTVPLDISPGEDRLTAFTPSGDCLVVQQTQNKYLIAALSQGEREASPTVGSMEFSEPLTAIALSPKLMVNYSVRGSLTMEIRPFQLENPPHRSSSGACNLTADTAPPRALAISSDNQWIIGVGRGQVELRHIDYPIHPSVHNADFENAAQVAIAADALRIAVVDQDGYLSVLALPGPPPEHTALRFGRLMTRLVAEKRYDDLDQLGDALQNDAEPFPFEPAVPKYHILVGNLFDSPNPLAPEVSGRDRLREWLDQKPESVLARILQAQNLIHEGWQARGSGFANTVSPEAFEKFHLRLLDAGRVLEPLVGQEKPPAEAIYYQLIIAKAESWSEAECMEHVDRLMEISPRYEMPHTAMVESLLPRWGGGPGDCARYAGQIADRIGGAEGDALYTSLAMTVVSYEGEAAAEEVTGLDFQRAYKGCQHLQQTPHFRTLGLLCEMMLADVDQDADRLARVVEIVRREKTPYTPGGIPARFYYDTLYRKYLGRPTEK